ncbi:uncharacterized protein [Ptychodera flava]|uniref:uncharacterized protein n=1 Tax=Ptychodera flava TaxID=63121 RepID=UPI00396A86F2
MVSTKGYRENLAKEKQKQRQGHTALNVCSERSDSNQVTDVAIADDGDFTFAHLQQNISQVKLPSGWTPRTSPARLMISQLECTDEDMKVSRTVTISDDLHWKVKIHGHDIPNTHPAFNDTSTVIDSFEMLEKLLALISDCNICCGNPEQMFVELLQSKGGEIVKAISFAGEKEVSAYLEGDFNATSLDGTSYHHTVRTSKCSLITDKNRCTECCKYRNNLRSLVSRRKSDNLGDENKTHSSSRTNLRYLTNQQLQQRAKKLTQ